MRAAPKGPGIAVLHQSRRINLSHLRHPVAYATGTDPDQPIRDCGLPAGPWCPDTDPVLRQTVLSFRVMSLPLRLQAIHLAALVSVLVHAGALIEIGQRYTAAGKRPDMPVVTFRAVITTPKPQARPQPAPEPGPVRQPKARRPVVRKKPPPKPKTIVRTETVAAPVPAPPATPPVATRPEPEAPLGMISVVKQQQDYTQKILHRIEQHKRYPLAARRRRLTGTVMLSLRLGAEGRIESLRCVTGSRLLCRAAEQATRAAAPFPPLPDGTHTLAFEYRMRFRLH